MYTLRPDQKQAVDGLRHSIIEGHRRLILCSPTGSGKTVMASHIIEAAVEKGRNVLFLAHARELIHQCSEKLTTNGVRHGVIMAGRRNEDPFAAVQVASKDTLVARAVRRDVMDLPPADLLILDECHRSIARTWRQLIDSYPGAVVLGLTATPARGDGRGLGEIYQDIVNAATYEQLIGSGSLVPTRVFAPSRPDLSGVRTSGGDYNKNDLAKVMDQPFLIGDIFDTWARVAHDRPTIVFASGIAHSMHIAEMFRARGITTDHIDGNTPADERDWALTRLRMGDTQILCNVGVCTEGFDCPPLSCAVIARPTKSIVLYRQMAGRIQRPCAGKDDALIIDHSGTVYRFGFPDEDIDWPLTRDENISKKKMEEAREPRVCKACGFVLRGQVEECPECGEPVPKRKAKPVEVRKGHVSEVKRRKANMEATQSDKQKAWDRYVGICINRDWKMNRAAGMYKGQFGVYPNSQVEGVPRGKQQWHMRARDFYEEYGSLGQRTY